MNGPRAVLISLSDWPSYGQRLISRVSGIPIVKLGRADRRYAGYDLVFLGAHCPRDYYNVPRLFARLKIALLAEKRRTGPIFVLGGFGCSNPLPLSKVVDFVFVGEAEEFVGEVLEGWRKAGSPGHFREWLGSLDSVYRLGKESVRKRYVESLPGYAVPVHGYSKNTNRDYLEITRGCRSRCSYCMLGWTRPFVTVLPPDKLREFAPYPTLNLLSPNSADYPDRELLAGFGECSGQNVRIRDVLRGYRGPHKQYSFGLEGFSERLRKLVKKSVANADVVEAFRALADRGINNAKFYMIFGLPTEGEEDRREFLDLLYRIEDVYHDALRIHFTPFQPSPHTPLENVPFEYNHRSREFARELGTVYFQNRLKKRIFGGGSESKALLDHLALSGGAEFAETLRVLSNNKRYLSGKRDIKAMHLRGILEKLGGYGKHVHEIPLSRPWRVVTI